MTIFVMKITLKAAVRHVKKKSEESLKRKSQRKEEKSLCQTLKPIVMWRNGYHKPMAQ